MAKKKRSAETLSHLSFEVDIALVRQVDLESERMTEEDPHNEHVSRSRTVRTLILDGLRARAERRAQQQQPSRRAARA